MSVTETQTPELGGSVEQIAKERTFDEIVTDHDHFLRTGEFQSSVLAKVGNIPNPDDFANNTDQAGEFGLGFLNFGAVTIKDGALDFSDNPDITEEEKIEVQRSLEPLLLMIDEDYRHRIGVGPEAETRPSVDYRHGTVTERQTRGDETTPHIDGYGYTPDIIYFAALGAGTKIFPGRFKLSEPHVQTSRYDEIIDEVKDQNITPVSVGSGEVVAVGWDTVHAAPGPEAQNQTRAFIRVWYNSGYMPGEAKQAQPAANIDSDPNNW